MQAVKLNIFQRLMRLWDEVHPYNAVHTCRIAGPADIQRISDAWRISLKAMGVGKISVNKGNFRHVAPSDSECSSSIQLHSGMSLDELVTNEMNTRMNPDEGCPFRAFVLDEGNTHCVGVNYHHWVADSASIRWLMNEWFIHMQDPSRNGICKARIPTQGQWHYFGPDSAGWRLDEGFMALLRNRTRFSRMRYIDKPVTDSKVAITFHHLPDGVGPKLASLAKRSGATFNDVMVAAMAQVVDVHGVTPANKDRDELSIGTIVDLRNTASQKMDDIFGLFLGFITTIVRAQDLQDWDRLLQRVARQNTFQKHSKAAHASILRMVAAVLETKLVTPRRWGELYRRRMPLAAGISNVNMNRTWVGQHHPQSILDYYRIAPTGPIIPAAFTPTTLGSRMNFGITRLSSLIDPTHNQRIASSLSDRLIDLASEVR